MKTLLLFGTFDGIHDGHRRCFAQAKTLTDHLVISLPSDAMVEKLKGHLPRYTLKERTEGLQKEPLVDEVVLGDRDLGSYGVIDLVNPDAVALGYDQHALAEDIRSWAQTHRPQLQFIRLDSFQPEIHKSSKLNEPSL